MSRLYLRRPQMVEATRLAAAALVQTTDETLAVPAGDWLVSDFKGHTWVMSARAFAAAYEDASGLASLTRSGA